MTRALREAPLRPASSETLDPNNWDEIRAQGHRMLDDMIDYIADIRDRPVWSPIPDAVRARFRAGLPRQATDLGEVYREFADFVLPYATGNVHPGFMGWVHGGGTAVVHNMDSPELFPYKPPQMRKIFEAFAAMLMHRAREGRERAA